MTETGLVVVLTAMDLEYSAVRAHLVEPETHRHGAGTRFEIGTVRDTGCRVALGLTGVGNQSSAVIAERAIQEFAPVLVLFVGVAGALWDKPGLGDVVVAERVYAYHGGTSEDDGFKARPRAWEAPHAISQLAHQLERSGDWRRRLPAGSGSPEVRFGAIVAGEIVQNSRISPEAQRIRDQYNDAIAIEMEAAGVAHAGHLNSSEVGIIRGVSDRADGTKTTDGDIAWQPRAARNAAAFAIHLAVEVAEERMKGIQVSNGTTGSRSALASVATERFSTTVAGLRRQLERDHAFGEVDDDTYEAAGKELDNAEKASLQPGPTGTKQSLLALKRLRGLVAGVAGIVASTAEAIAAAEHSAGPETIHDGRTFNVVSNGPGSVAVGVNHGDITNTYTAKLQSEVPKA